MDLKRVNVLITGRVQGVGYRYFAQEKATTLDLTGWVRNLPNGDVEAVAEGTATALAAWIKQLERGPALARVTHIQTDWLRASTEFQTFEIH